MNNPIKRLTLDVNKAQNYETITVKQGDANSRTYKITLVSNGQVVTLATTDSVKAKAERGGETVAFIACTKTENEITLTLSPAMLAVAGDLKVELMVYSGAAKLTSATQNFYVSRSIPESPIVSTPDFSALNDMVKRAEAVIASPTVDGELKDARGGETALRYRLEKIESGQRIAQGVITNDHIAYGAVDTNEITNGAVTLDKMDAEAKAAFAAASHKHDGAYIPNTNGAVTPALLSAAAKALFAPLEYAGAAKFLPDDITIRAGSIKGAVNSAAIQSGAVTTRKLADGAVTEQKIAEAFVNKYGHLPFTDVTDYGNSADIPYDDYTNNGIYRFTGRYTPVLLFVFIGSVSYTTQIRIQGEQIQSRFFNIREWTEWSGGKAEIAESLTQLDAQIAQLQIDTQAHGAKLDTLDRMYAGTATIATTNSYNMDAAQVVPNSKVYLTLTNGPSTSCFVRSDHYPLYYYGTNQVVQPEYNAPVSVSAEDLIAGIELNYGGAFTIQYQTAPSKVFFDYADNAAKNAKRELAEQYNPYVTNQITGHAEGTTAEITDGAPGTLIKSATVRGESKVDEAGTITPLSPTDIAALSNDGTVENHVNLPAGLQLYSTPNNQYYDTYNAVTGMLTRNCGKVLLASAGWIYGYSTSAAAVTWITANNYVPSKSYYMAHNGAVSTQTTDWQGKISLTVNKTDAGITAEDTAAAAAQKIKTYFGEAYAILPLKTPTTEQLEPVQLAIPTKECAVVCNNGYLDVAYCRDINTAYLDLLEYTTGMEARITQLEIITGGGGTI